MSVSIGARAILLDVLAHVVARYRHDHAAGGLIVIRRMRSAGAWWSDLLPGPAFDATDPQLELLPCGYRLPMSGVAYGRAIRTLLPWSTPYELAQWAVALDRDEVDDIESLRSAVVQLLARRAQMVPVTQ